jgi:SAM-dependent methyltransferase
LTETISSSQEAELSMTWREYSVAELQEVSGSVGDRIGWDFSHMATEQETAPWDFLEVVSRYLRPGDSVLDIGTGGGERLLSLARQFHTAIGVDPDPAMVHIAREHGRQFSHVSFLSMGAEQLDLDDSLFDVVLTRHAPTYVPELHRVTKPSGLFICQGIGGRNMGNIREAFETGSGSRYEEDGRTVIADLAARGWHILATASYDVRYWVKDLPSLMFWFKAIAGANEVPADFSVPRHADVINSLIAQFASDRGLETNEHRTLLIARKAE